MENKRKRPCARAFKFLILCITLLCVQCLASNWISTSLAAGTKEKASVQDIKAQAVLAQAQEKAKSESAAGEGKSAENTAPQAAKAEEKPAPSAPVEETPPVPEEVASVEPGNVTVNFKGADIRTVLAYLSEVSGIDIVASPDVKGTVDLRLTNKPWNIALDVIVRNYGFAYERDGDIIRVVTLDKMRQEEITTQAFSLNYGKAKDVVTSVKDMLTDRGKVMYDERTNVVLVADIPTNVYKVGRIIDKLDRRTEQVLIEARVIEAVLDQSEKLGIDWNVKITAAGAKRPTTLPFFPKWTKEAGIESNIYPLPSHTVASDFVEDKGTWVPNPNADPLKPETAFIHPFVPKYTITSDFPYKSDPLLFPTEAFHFGAFPMAASDQFTFGTLDFTSFKAVLEMIKSRGNTNTVSNPRIATLNNSEATIMVGQTLNMPAYERNSSTGKMEITGYDSKDLGIKLKVTPHINEKQEIVVDLTPEISALLRYDTLDAASGVVAPVFSIRQANTKVLIKDGDTIFIGGLISESDIDTRTKLPIIGDLLGDVPFLGLLVSHKGTTKQKTELIFFITVRIITPDMKLENVPQADKAYVPNFDYTQKDWKNTAKKRKIKPF